MEANHNTSLLVDNLLHFAFLQGREQVFRYEVYTCDVDIENVVEIVADYQLVRPQTTSRFVCLELRTLLLNLPGNEASLQQH